MFSSWNSPVVYDIGGWGAWLSFCVEYCEFLGWGSVDLVYYYGTVEAHSYVELDGIVSVGGVAVVIVDSWCCQGIFVDVESSRGHHAASPNARTYVSLGAIVGKVVVCEVSMDTMDEVCLVDECHPESVPDLSDECWSGNCSVVCP